MAMILPPPLEAVQRAQLRQPAHEPARPGVREARGRNGEILTRNNRHDPVDQFELPRQMIERGWSYQWVRRECLGKPDPSNLTSHHENGWRPVPASRCPGYFHPHDYAGSIEREGLVLMERPQSLTDEATRDHIERARRQKHNQAADFQGVEKILDETGGTSHAFAPSSAATDSRGVARPQLKRSVEAAPTSLYPTREYAIGDD